MATWPTYARILLDGASESFDPSVDRTEMERGVPKQRLINSGVLQKLGLTVVFFSAADVAAFEDWYFNTLSRIGWFQMPHPRTRTTITARFEDGSIGTLSPAKSAYGIAQRAIVVEYLR